MVGLLFSTQEHFAEADKHLRAALPYRKIAICLPELIIT